jgi:hypothetical protein
MADASLENAPALIQSAAMGVKKFGARRPHVFEVKEGPVSGSAEVLAPAAGRRAFYEWEYSSDGGKTWQAMPPTTRSNNSLSGLQPGASISFRFRSVTKAGPSDWSQPVVFIVR